MNKDEEENGRLPFEFQCKTTTTNLNYHKLIKSMPGKSPPVILHKYTEKSNKGKFVTKGTYAIMQMDCFLDLISHK